MATDLEKREIDECLEIIDRMLPLVSQAKSLFSSARNWGFLDMFGGGLVTDLFKHSKLRKASGYMNQINAYLRNLENELKDVHFSTDFSMTTFGFSSFADIVFDGIIADTYMQSKILKSLDQIRDLEQKLGLLQIRLLDMKKN